MSDYRWADLAWYNAERARGVVHTPEWQAKMAEEQRLFDEEMRRRRESEDRSSSGEPPRPHTTLARGRGRGMSALMRLLRRIHHELGLGVEHRSVRFSGGPDVGLVDAIGGLSVEREAIRSARCSVCSGFHASDWCPLERAWKDSQR